MTFIVKRQKPIALKLNVQFKPSLLAQDMTESNTVLIVPGLRDHVPDHWQTLLAAKLPRVHTVAPLEHAGSIEH